MTWRPGDWLFLPALASEPAAQVLLQYTAAALVLVWALLVLRAGRAGLLVGGVLLVQTVLAFWIAGFGRPYGLFTDPAITRGAAHAASAALGGGDGFLAGEPRRASLGTVLVAAGLPADLAIAAPTLLPLIVVPLLAVAVFALGRPCREAEIAAALWLAFSTTQAEAVRGAGFLTGIWARPGSSLLLVTVVVAVLACSHLRSRRAALVAGLAVVALSAPAWPNGTSPAAGARVLLATVDQLPWILLAAWGLARAAPAPAWALVAGGGGLFLLGPAWGADAWGAHAMYRLGLFLAAARPLRILLRAVGAALARRAPRWVPRRPERVALALVLAAAVPGSFLARWEPAKLDPLAAAAREPLSLNLQPSLEWLRANVPPNDTCLASPEYAPAVAVLGGRRVLRAPSLAIAADDQRRRRTERMLAAGREPDLWRRYGLGCLFLATGEETWLGLPSRESVEALPGLRLGYRDAYASVYRVTAGAPP